jgi:Type IV pilin-like G and H, putative
MRTLQAWQMYLMAAKKMSENAAKASNKSRLSVSSLLPRIAIYSAVVAGLIASFYDFRLKEISILNNMESSEARQVIARINKAQQAYYKEHNQFSDSFAKLGIEFQEKIGRYHYRIVPSIGPVQSLHNHPEPAQFERTIATAAPEVGGTAYRSEVFAFKEKGSDRITTISAICEGENEGITVADLIFDGSQIYCP